jgi:hypothetical protein
LRHGDSVALAEALAASVAKPVFVKRQIQISTKNVAAFRFIRWLHIDRDVPYGLRVDGRSRSGCG